MPLKNNSYCQTKGLYKAPQDTTLGKRPSDESLNTYQERHQQSINDSRLLGAAYKAAQILSDTAAYDINVGISVEVLFSGEDLQYFANRGIPSVIALFELINKKLPEGRKLDFVSDSLQTISVVENPLVMKNLKMSISEKPASITSDPEQWKENVYLAYMARDYGTKLNNTITIMAATTEMRKRPDLELIDYSGLPITLGQILNLEQEKSKNSRLAESEAVKAFRLRTFPSEMMTKANANENYRRALLALVSLQEKDFKSHQETMVLLGRLSADLAKGMGSKAIAALQGSNFFDKNVPGNIGYVLLTQSTVLNGDEIAATASSKARELLTLTALHYGERDAVKLLSRLLQGQGALDAEESQDFTAKRVAELRFHGVEKFKALGFSTNKTKGMTMADLVLVAVAAPEVPVNISSKAALTVLNAGRSIVNNYSTVQMEETRNTFQLNPRILFGTRHIEHRSAYDAVDFVPELIDGRDVGQRGSGIWYNGLELRLESDIYFSNLKRMHDRGLKPWIFPEFGILLGSGYRKVGYDEKTIEGRHGAVPKFKQRYGNWGGHMGLNLGPVMVGVDATILSTEVMDKPDKKFFDLSQAMTYFRYTMLIHAVNYQLNIKELPSNLTFDLEVSGETNNEGTFDRTTTQNGSSQTGSGEWQQDYDRAHPGGVYNAEIAESMILNGDVKAAYAASNFAAAHISLHRGGFQLKLSAGLYNLRAIKGRGEGVGEWLGELFRNTANGNLFGGMGLAYHFGSRKSVEKYKRSVRYSEINGLASTPEAEESTIRSLSASGLQNRSLWSNTKR